MDALEKIWERCAAIENGKDIKSLIGLCRQGLQASEQARERKLKEKFLLRLAEGLIAYRQAANYRQNLDEAIAILEGLLQVGGDTPHSTGPSKIKFCLGEACLALGNEEGLDNLWKAIGHYNEAEKLLIDAEHTACLPRIQVGLMIAFRDLAEAGGDDKFYDSAIACGKQALGLLRPAENIEFVAGIETQLGIFYGEKNNGNLTRNRELAIWHYRNALMLYDNMGERFLWANTANLLGVAFANRVKGTREKNVNLALHYYTGALQAFKQLEQSSLESIRIADEIDEVAGNKITAQNELIRLKQSE